MRILDFLNAIEAPGPSRKKVQPLSLPLQEHLLKILKSKTLAKEEFLLQETQTSTRVCFIESGLLRCFNTSADGKKEFNRWFMREGEVIFSISSFYEQKPSQENIQALERTQLLYISYDELEEIYSKFPEFERIGRLVTSKYHVLWDQLLLAAITMSAEERYDWLAANHPELLKRVAAKHLASHLGISAEYFSKIKSIKSKKR